MEKVDVLLTRATVSRISCILLAAAMAGYGSLSSAQDSGSSKGYVTVQEHNKLKQEMESLKKQMQVLVKSSSGVPRAKPPSATASKTKANEKGSQQASNPSTSKAEKEADAGKQAKPKPDSGMNLAEGDRKKEAAEAKRQLDVFLRNQKLLFKKGELQTELDLMYSKNSLGNQFFTSTGTSLPIQADRSIGMNALARYGLFDNVEFDLTLPFSYVEEDSALNAFSTSKGNRYHFERTGLRDINLGLRYAAWREDGTLPDVILSVVGSAPTGSALLGSGDWGITTNTTLVKTLDPVVLFGSLGYATYVNTPDSNAIPYSIGMGFSLNDRVSFSMSMSGSAGLNRSDNSVLKVGSYGKVVRDRDGNPVIDKPFTYSSTDINTMQFSSTVQVKKNLSVEPFVSFGLTKESPDFALGIRLPYRLEGKHPLPF